MAGLDAGTATFRLTASRSGYSSASTEVTVTVYLPPVGLSVPTSLEFEQGATGVLTVRVSESTQATITIESGNVAIARVPDSAATFTLMGGEGNSTMIEVSGDNMIGDTTLKITARADGYETETVIVMVDVLSRLRIEAPVTFDLTERESTQISVRLTRIEAGIETVILEIAPEEGSGLTVDPSSLTFMDTQPQTVTVIATNDDLLTGDRSGILTLTATTGSYAVETVTIMILDNPSVVGVTTLENQASTTISEADGTVTLKLNINPPFDSPSQVNILYSGDPGALTGVSSSATVDDIETDEMVPVGVREHIFNVSVMNDDIAEFIRQVDVSVASGPAYQAASSSVKITVEDDDVATVSISPVETAR